jgi:hypothetical protein
VDLLIARAQLPAALISVTFRLCSDADNRCIVQKSHFFGPAKGQS